MNNKWKPALWLLIVITGFTMQLSAQEIVHDSTGHSEVLRKNAIGFCPLGMAFGVFSVNYERQVHEYHTVVLRADYESIPETFEQGNIDTSGYAAVVNYRVHSEKHLNSIFLGLYARYRNYSGNGELSGESFDFQLPELTIGANIGRRWIWGGGFSAVFALGYGYSWSSQNISELSDSTAAQADSALAALSDHYALASPFLGEFSIGYAF